MRDPGASSRLQARQRRRDLLLLMGLGLGVVGLVVVLAGVLADAGWDGSLPSLANRGEGPLEVAGLLCSMVGVAVSVWALVRLWRRRPFPSLFVHGVDPGSLRRAKAAVRRGELPQGPDRALALRVADGVTRQSEPLLPLGTAFLQAGIALADGGAMRWLFVTLAVALLALALFVAVQRRRAQTVLQRV